MLRLTDDMLTDIPRIDKAHGNIIEQAHKVLNAFKKGQGQSVVHDSIAFLETYLVDHFHDEEALQIETGYPYYEKHHKAHEELIERMSLLILEYDDNADSPVTKKMLIELIFEVFFNHIRTLDKGLAEHIKKHSSHNK